jgi:hypothetical protein
MQAAKLNGNPRYRVKQAAKGWYLRVFTQEGHGYPLIKKGYAEIVHSVTGIRGMAMNAPEALSFIELNKGHMHATHETALLAPVIPAEVHSDDFATRGDFDALAYFMQAGEQELLKLADCGWGGDYPADEVAQHMASLNAGVKGVFTYIENTPNRVGYECVIDGDKALEWIKTNRPGVYKKIQSDEDLAHAAGLGNPEMADANE